MIDSARISIDSIGHIRARLSYVNLLLRRAVVLARATRPLTDVDAFRGMAISEEAVDRMIETVTIAGETQQTHELLAGLDAEIERRRREDAVIASGDGWGSKPSLLRLMEIFGLEEVEAELVLIALAPEIDTRYETIYAYLQNDVTRKRPGVELALDLICRTFEEKLAARRFLTGAAPLLYFRIIEMGEDAYDRRPTLLRQFLKLDESVIRFLLDQPAAESVGVRVMPPSGAAPDVDTSADTGTALDSLVQALRSRGTQNSIVQLYGKPDAPLEHAAIAVGSALDRPLFIADPSHLTQHPDAAAAFIRDAALWKGLPVLMYGEPPDAAAERAKPQTAEAPFWSRLNAAGLDAIVLGGPDDPGRFPIEMSVWRIAIEAPDAARRTELWQAATRDRVPDAEPKRLADMFPFGAALMQRAIGLASTRAALRNPSEREPTMADLVQAGRVIATPNLQRFAVTVTLRYDWDDLVLPSDRRQQLQSVAARVANRQIVQRDWGFGEKLSRGRGVAVLFSGLPGTGKTMAAEVLARALSLELFQIDLSTVVSKYIGETEKQLGSIFAEAERSQCILFFDECDAIFGKRTEVKDAHDRYANTEVNYLLQRLEQYDGIVLLATNFQKNIDDAFLRRLHDSIDFPFPDEVAREQIWRKQFPRQAPVDSAIDFGFLAAQFKIPGGNIRNAALYAAFRAAEEGGFDATIRMAHVLDGVRREFQKQGKLMMATDLRRYAPAFEFRKPC